ncbi:MAG: 30S ribosomal protein S17 [Thermoplasmata archaeon]|nr:MAG: 30S ribosomal protein S17 [Thermoplasmata archaeon]OYT61974.1 MAG: 30S ribosomal protein S17 [Thermoplasmatales archaeon ex4484_30]
MIGIDVEEPKEKCNDENCPWHGHLKVRGIILEGKVVSTAMQSTVVVERERLHYVPKYERYEKRTSRYKAHLPPCIEVKKGDEVVIMECRPLSKTKHFVVVAKK